MIEKVIRGKERTQFVGFGLIGMDGVVIRKIQFAIFIFRQAANTAEDITAIFIPPTQNLGEEITGSDKVTRPYNLDGPKVGTQPNNACSIFENLALQAHILK